VVGLFGRARSAGISLLLATQELADLRLSGRERMLDQVLGNLSLLIAHRQVLPASAELLAGLAGSEEVWRVSRHSDGRAIRTRAREPALQPDRLAGLQTGCAAVFEVGSGRGARITRVRAGAGT
ncbi:MAG TPA: TraM recognition domain-containing protein, partial [Gaiellales bacterium]|nr:TraM recognition domain-containing protein [Gaiellales bacterium]